MLELLLLGAELKEDCRTGREGRDLDPPGEHVPRDLIIEDVGVGAGESLAAVLLGEAQTSEAPIEELSSDRSPPIVIEISASAFGMLSASQARARSRKDSRSSVWFSLILQPPWPRAGR